MDVYDFKVKNMDGSECDLRDYKGKVLLIVNTATECGFTPQYKDLQEIYDEFHDKGLEILDFPCDQFGNQAPGTDEEIHSFCTGRYGITFPQFHKIEVNGDNADPLYKYLTENSRFEGFGKGAKAFAMDKMLKAGDKEYAEKSSIKWNFTKFLISRDGKILGRFEPTNNMKDVKKAIEEAVN